MGVALDAGLDLGGLAGCYVAIGLLAIIVTLLEGLDRILNVQVLGVRPFGGIASAIEGTLVAGLNSALSYLEAKAASFESGLIDSLAILIAAPILIVEGVDKALSYLWSSALKPTIHAITNPIRTEANQALALAKTAEKDAAGAVAKAADYTDAAFGHVLALAATYAEKQAAAVLSTSERYAADAVEALRGAESTAIAGALRVANEARAAGDAAVAALPAEVRSLLAQAEQTAEGLAAGAAAEAEAVAARALAEAQASGQAALEVVRAVATAAEQGTLDLEHLIEANGWAALLASIPALAILVNAIATEAGLGNASCRSKVSNICQTDPLAWANLLGGLAALGFAFSLRDLYSVAEGLVGDLSGVIAQAA